MAKNREKILAQINAILALSDEVLDGVQLEAHIEAHSLAALTQFCDAIGTKWREHSRGMIHTDYDWSHIRGVAKFPNGMLGSTERTVVITSDVPDLSLVNRCES